jgi:hypothetical protein
MKIVEVRRKSFRLCRLLSFRAVLRREPSLFGVATSDVPASVAVKVVESGCDLQADSIELTGAAGGHFSFLRPTS